MSNQYLPEEYTPKGFLYRLPIVGDAIKDALIPQDVQERRARKASEEKMLAEGVTTGFNDRLLDDMRADGLLGQNYKPLDTDELSFGANLLSVDKNEGGTQFTPKYDEYIEDLFADFPLLTKTQTVGGTTEDFKPTNVVYNGKNNTVFLVGKNYKGDMAPKTLMQSDEEGDQIAEYSLSDFNELSKLALNTKYINSNYKPGYLSNAREDVEGMANDVYEQIALSIKEANEQGLIDDPDVLNLFNEGIAGMIADQQDPEAVAKQDDQIPGIALTEIRPEITALLEEGNETPEPTPLTKEQQKEFEAYKREVQVGFAYAGGTVKPPSEEQLLENFKRQKGISGPGEMVDGSTLTEDEQWAVVEAWNNMNAAERVSFLSTGLIFIPGLGAAGYAAARGVALTASTLSKAKIGTRLLNWAKKLYTKPSTTTSAVSKAGNKFPVTSPQGQQIVKAGEADLKRRTAMEKVKDFGTGNTGNPRVVTENVVDAAGNVIRQFDPLRAGATGLITTGVTGQVASGMIQGELDEIELAEEQAAAGAAPEQDLEPLNIPEFKSPQEAATWFQDDNNYAKFVAAATSKGAQNVAAKLEEAFETLGINDAQSFTTNIEEIKARINPANDFKTNQTLAALIAERSGASKETQATLFNQTLTALTSSDRLDFEVAKERRSIASASIEDFTEYYLKDFDTSTEVQEISSLFYNPEGGTSFDDLQGQMLLQRNKFKGKYPELFPEYKMTANGPVNIKRAQIMANASRRGLNQTQITQLQNNIRQVESLERAQTNETVKALINKYSETGWWESIKNFFAGRNPFANPEDEIFSYISVEVNQKEDGSYDPVRFQIRQPNSGAKSSVVIEDHEFIREFGNLDSAYQMSFYANIGKRNIKVLNKKKGSGTGP